jgi:MraZ protein
MFRGTFEQRIDEKGRINVPVKFRDALRELGDDRLFLTNFRVGDTRCLEGRPYAEWLREEARIGALTNISPAAKAFWDNFYLPGAQELTIDKQGRLLVPPTLRDFAELAKDVVFTGAGLKFRLWDHAKWETVRQAAEQHVVFDQNVLTELGL